MRSSKTVLKTSRVASAVWHVAPSCCKTKCCQYPPLHFLWTKIRSTWPDNDRNWMWRPLLAHVSWKFNYACGPKFAPNSDSFWVRRLFNVHTRQDENELHLKRWFFFAKMGIFCKSIEGPLVHAYTQPYSFGGRIKLIIYQISYELSVTIHKISSCWKKKTLDGGPCAYLHLYIIGHYNASVRITF